MGRMGCDIWGKWVYICTRRNAIHVPVWSEDAAEPFEGPLVNARAVGDCLWKQLDITRRQLQPETAEKKQTCR